MGTQTVENILEKLQQIEDIVICMEKEKAELSCKLKQKDQAIRDLETKVSELQEAMSKSASSITGRS